MAATRDKIVNTTVKQVLRMGDGLHEMVQERLARNEMQMVRSQSADIGSGFLAMDNSIAIKNLQALQQAVDDAVAAMVLVIEGAKTVHHDYEELTISEYDTPGGVGSE